VFKDSLQFIDCFDAKTQKRPAESAGITPNTLICGKTDTCVTLGILSDCNGISNNI
jgi:hypothetical protein